jgi:hypothetical protein
MTTLQTLFLYQFVNDILGKLQQFDMTLFYFKTCFGMIAAYVMLLELIAKKVQVVTLFPGRK